MHGGARMVLKWAWIQYAVLMIIIYMIFRYVRRFVFINQIVPTFIDDPLLQIQKARKNY